ncbi:LCP family protein [Bacillus sp. KH172YL63]|uniref:LCP family protein n=1 Tax=Bacillus sp. KH172YL63 TaxID=2709784 RepID=UPI0013E522E2|nr:LCP family protein [Bacillus sp. KH172YL63]BCB05753.1 putative transcriptional regulator YvhJ [Bacillus sp. KH172YL63]
MDRIRTKTKKRRRLRIKRILLLFGFFLLLIGAYGSYVIYSAYEAANKSYSELDRGEKSKLREEAIEVQKDPFSLLIMGVEDYSSGGAHGRTDSLMVATFNPEDQSVKLLSIPRDTLTEIADTNEKDKINHAYASGGKEATIESVENLLNIPIDYYVTIGFDSFKDIINEVGGVSVDVPFDFYEKSDEDNQKIYFTEGTMELDGEEALAYARMRKQDPRGDYGRNDRQKQILEATIDKLLSPSTVTKLDNIAEHIGNNVQTNMKVSQALAIQSKYPNFSTNNIEKLSLEGYDEYINDIFYFVPDETELAELTGQLKNHLNQ